MEQLLHKMIQQILRCENEHRVNVLTAHENYKGWWLYENTFPDNSCDICGALSFQTLYLRVTETHTLTSSRFTTAAINRHGKAHRQ